MFIFEKSFVYTRNERLINIEKLSLLECKTNNYMNEPSERRKY